MTISALRAGCVTLVKGIGGMQFGTKPLELSSTDQVNAERACIAWWTAVTEAIGPAFEDRANSIASAPSVIAAVGAFGNSLMQQPLTHMDRVATQLAASLKAVQWERGEHWARIAGKISPTGRFSVGGTKETAYQVYKALFDADDPSFKTIRGQSAARVS